jgi:hypothetical protein
MSKAKSSGPQKKKMKLHLPFKKSDRSKLAAPIAQESRQPEVTETTQSANSTPNQTLTEKLRKKLTHNKIFFETLAATALTLMAVVLSLGQLRVTQEQTTYLELQTTIQRAQASPQFVVVLKQVLNEVTGYASEDKLFIYNQGNIARKIEANTAVFFKLSYVNKANFQEKLVPITGYFWITAYSGDATGLVLTIQGSENILKRREIQDVLDSLADANNVIINLEVQRYVKLTYRDIFNEVHTEYYFVPATGGSELISVEKGKTLFEDYINASVKGTALDLDKMEAQDLYNLFP